MYLHVWQGADESIVLQNLKLEPIEWTQASAESLLFDLSQTFPKLASTYYCVEGKDKQVQFTIIGLAILYVYGGLYVFPKGKCRILARGEFPLPLPESKFSSRLHPTILVDSTDVCKWMFALNKEDATIHSVLTALQNAKNSDSANVLKSLKSSILQNGSSMAPNYDQINANAQNAFVSSELVQNEVKNDDVVQKADQNVKEKEDKRVWDVIVEKLSGKEGIKFSTWSKVLLGVGALLLIAFVVYFVWKRVDPKGMASNTMSNAKKWFQNQMVDIDRKIGKHTTKILDNIAKKIH